MQITVRDETAAGSVTNELTLDVFSESVTVRELIRSRVYQEVQDYNLRQRQGDATFHGLVTPADAERTLNGYRLRERRQINWKDQFDKAIEAFSQKQILVLVGDQQVDSLEQEIELRPDTQVSFVRLVMLVGG